MVHCLDGHATGNLNINSSAHRYVKWTSSMLMMLSLLVLYCFSWSITKAVCRQLLGYCHSLMHGQGFPLYKSKTPVRGCSEVINVEGLCHLDCFKLSWTLKLL